MSVMQKPMVGNWYMNLNGQLIRVWALGYSTGCLSNVVIEHLNGNRRIISISEWRTLDLEVHLYRAARHHRGSEELHR